MAEQIACGHEPKHAAYHIAALAALFGRVETVTNFAARCLLPEKVADVARARDGGPDFSVAALRFGSGVVARLTCSVVAPYEYRVRLVGDSGADYLRRSLAQPLACARGVLHPVEPQRPQSPCGPGTARCCARGAGSMGAARPWYRGSVRPPSMHEPPRAAPGHSVLRGELRRRQMTSMDFLLGVEVVRSELREGRDPVITAEFLLHVNEVTLAVAARGTLEGGLVPTHTSTPVAAPRTSGRPFRPRHGRMTTVLESVLPTRHRRS